MHHPKIQDIQDADKKLNVMIYGDSGTGKTRFIGTAVKRFKTLVASAEKGTLSIKKLIEDIGPNKGVHQWNVESFKDLEDCVNFFLFSKHDYECLALDSGTEIQQRCMESILLAEKRSKPQQQDWGTLNDKMAGLTRKLRDCKYNVIMTALAETDVDQLTGEQKIMPMFQGRYQKASVSFFDEVFYAHTMSKKNPSGEMEVDYKLLTANSGKFLGKDRSGKLLKIVDPDFSAIYDTIFNTKGDSK